jgi:hypothetical protein
VKYCWKCVKHHNNGLIFFLYLVIIYDHIFFRHYSIHISSPFTMSCTHHYQFLWWVCLIRYVIVNFYNVMYTSLPVLMMGVFDQVPYCQLLQCHVHIITNSYDGCVWSGTLLSTFTMSCTHHYQFLWWVCLIRYVIVNFFYIYKIQSSFDFILFKSQTILITWFLDPPACLFWDND